MRPVLPSRFAGFGLELKSLRKEDLPLLCQWRNSAHVLPHMDVGRPVPLSVLEFWFKKIDTYGGVFPFMVYRKDVPVAYLEMKNCDFTKGVGVDGTFLAESRLQGSGLASLIWLLREALLRALNISIVISYIKSDNIRSIRFYEKMGGSFIKSENGFRVCQQLEAPRLATLCQVAASHGLQKEFRNSYCI